MAELAKMYPPQANTPETSLSVALSGSGTVKIYAASKPAAAITLQSILCIKAV